MIKKKFKMKTILKKLNKMIKKGKQ